MSNPIRSSMARLGLGRATATARFVIIGLPRSGTTYLMTLLNSHPDVICHGELYNPYAVISSGGRDESHDEVLGRDKDPVAFLDGVFARGQGKRGVAALGFKFMLGQNLAVLRAILDDPEIRIIYVKRWNKLAQVASWLAALKSMEWARPKARKAGAAAKVRANPRKISQHWHEFDTQEMMFEALLEGRPQARLDLEYRELFEPGIAARLCDFLGVRARDDLTSPLAKQGANHILDRFEHPDPIKYYFRQIGRGDWLNDEL